MATKDAPSAPAIKVQGFICLALTALKISKNAARFSRLAREIVVTKISPVENETTAASSESPISWESAPLILDWAAIKSPDKPERKPKPT